MKEARKFWRKVSYGGECWEWQGTKTHDGYGQFMLQGKRWVTHRLLWHMLKGPIPAGMSVCHQCDNPSCVRIDHLFLATQQENQLDCINKKRRPRKPSCALPKLSLGLAGKIRREWKDVPTAHLAERLNVSRALIRKVRQGRAWKEN